MLIDSGCRLNLISAETWEYPKKNGVCCFNQEKEPNKTFLAYGNKTPLDVKGSFEGCTGRHREARFWYLSWLIYGKLVHWFYLW